MKKLVTLICFVVVVRVGGLYGQHSYTAAQVHSHNDYAQAHPFEGAYVLRCGSIEADVYLRDGELLVAHEPNEIDKERTLKALYLNPLMNKLNQGKGYPLQLLIDLKTPANPTLDTLVSQLKSYSSLIAPDAPIHIVVSGSMPLPKDFDKYPTWLYFDGRFGQTYTPAQLQRLGMISMSFGSIGAWSKDTVLPTEVQQKAIQWVEKAHEQGKKIRFWGTPDTPKAWQQLAQWKVDWIGTDVPAQVVSFFAK